MVGWIAFLLAALIATVVHPTPGALPRLFSLGVEGMVLYFVTRAVASEIGVSRTLIKVAISATLIVVLASLLAGIAGFRYDSILTVLSGSPMPPGSGARFGFIRQQGSFPAALFFAIWLAACTALVLPWSLSRERVTAALSTAAWAILVVGIGVLTVSRIALPTAFLMAGIYQWRWRSRIVATAAVVVGLVFAFGFAGLSVGEAPPGTSGLEPGLLPSPGTVSSECRHFRRHSDALAGSNEARVEAIKATIKAVTLKPVFGWGLLQAKDVVTSIGGSTNYVDSSYLVVAVEMGLVGLFAFLGLLAASCGVAGHGRLVTGWRSALPVSRSLP